MKIRIVLILALWSLSATNTFGWGWEGHDVVVRLALRRMKPSERKAVYDLLGTKDTRYIGHWADAVKDQYKNGNWHFVDIPDRDEHYNADRDCPNGDCIIAKLGMVQAQIQNHSLSRAMRREALLYWFHLVGDLYQPFHCYGDKAGGNGIEVYPYFRKKPMNLHKLWDDGIIYHKNPSPSDLAEEIWNERSRVPSPTTTFVDAAEKSHARAKEWKLKDGATVDSKYVDGAWGIIKTCLWEAACMASTIGPDV